MVRFVDLKTGNVFNADQSYVFWFDGEQSVNMLYSQPICFISNEPNVRISFGENKVFRLVDSNNLKNMDVEEIHNFKYLDINSMCLNGDVNTVLKGYAYHNYYIYMLYIIGSSPSAGEFIADINIAGETFKIGADFYGGDETLYINLSNHGVDIPEAIQKALYNVNIHEDKIDNITINRKWKELLSNYWDVLANKGSYKSLYNSLKWFEYGDLVRIGEIWKNKDHYEIRDIQEILSDKYIESLADFSKTTYEGLYLCLSKLNEEDGKIVYDKEKNPTLKSIVSKWSKEDLSLKMSMLGSFFETYFMPIHLDLIHSTIEDIVFTNTFKLLNSPSSNRTDFVYDIQELKCNVEDGAIFQLGPVECYVGPDTLFHTTTGDVDPPIIVGVQRKQPEFAPVRNEISNQVEIPNQVLKDYLTQLYYDVGAVVDFNIDIPLADDDFIKYSIISLPKSNQRIIRESYKPLGKNIQFSILFEDEGEYDLRMQFVSASGKTFVKRVDFNIIDTNRTNITVYKVQNIGCPMASFDRETKEWKYGANDYIFSRQVRRVPQSNIFQQYIPAKFINPYENDYNGVCLNHMMIIEGDWTHDTYLYRHYFTHIRDVKDSNGNDKKYTICISREFGFAFDQARKQRYSIYREDYIYMPEFHKLVELGSERGTKMEDIKYYTITDDDTLCVVPDISFGKNIDSVEWEFVNMSSPTHESIVLANRSISQPFIAKQKNETLSPGYYKVIFRYKLGNEVNEIVLDCAFRKI